MPLFALGDRAPQVHPGAWVAPTASLVGDVVVEEGASIWYGAVLRADLGRIVVRAGANVQDGSVIHGDTELACEIGVDATVAHLCVVHGAIVGEQAVIGNGSTVQDGAVIGRRSLIGAGSLVTPGTVIPDEVVALGSPCKVRGPLSGGAVAVVDGNPAGYQVLAALHREQLRLLD